MWGDGSLTSSVDKGCRCIEAAVLQHGSNVHHCLCYEGAWLAACCIKGLQQPQHTAQDRQQDSTEHDRTQAVSMSGGAASHWGVVLHNAGQLLALQAVLACPAAVMLPHHDHKVR